MIINWTNKAESELSKFQPLIARRIFKDVESLKEGILKADVRRLKGREGYRLRVGDYRVIFVISDETITVLKVGHRQNVYKQ